MTLAARRCGPSSALRPLVALEPWLAAVPAWAMREGALCRIFRFAAYEQTLAFANAVAAIAIAEDHHPELIVGYDRCEVRWSTHDVGGVSENDFICAAKVDHL